MKRSLLHNLSANTLQIATNQLFGLLIFYFLSRFLNKAEFGEINWTLAILLTAFNILTFGIDQIIIRKIAADEDPSKILSLSVFHVAFTGLVFYGLLIILHHFLPFSFHDHTLLLLLGIGKLMLFFSTPYKQLVSGQEKFKLLLYMSVPSSIIKGIALTWLAFSNQLNIKNVILSFIAGDLFELFFSIIVFNFFLKISLHFKIVKKEYFQLIKESLPQLGTVLFSSAIARFDWIFIGVFLSAAKLAEYSFAYKIFEMSTLPLLIIAPVLIPLFTRQVREGKEISRNKDLMFLLRLELIIASFIALLMNSVWAPVIDPLTAGKYGSVNTTTIFILTMAMPALYLNNFLWTIFFAQGRLKIILRIFALTFLVNAIGNIILIPLFKNEGAALAYLLASIVQTILYLHKLNQSITISWQPMVISTLCALGSGLIARNVSFSHWFALAFAIALYLFFLLITVQVKKSDWGIFKRLLNL